MNINFTGKKNIFLALSTVLVIASILSISLYGFKLAVDFTGGSLWQVKVPGVDAVAVQNFFQSDLKLDVFGVSYDAPSETYSLTLKELSDADRQADFSLLKQKFPNSQDVDFWRVSPSVSKELRQKSIMAVVFVMVAISLYVTFVFRKVSRPVSSWKYGIITLCTLIHNVLISSGVFALLGKLTGVAMDTNFIVALLVVAGFSVHDNIVVFDRIRENLTKSLEAHHNLAKIINRSLNETFARSVNTSLTLVLVLLAIYFLGPVSLKYF
ncbi:MAG: protein translocase subunit SecF, partial [Patescibacteria group bacterium]